MNKFTPLQLGWVFSGLHFSLTYLISTLHMSYFPECDLTFIEDQIGLIRWMEWKGGLSRPALDAYALFSLLLAPFSVVGWHYFAVDARPRRPKPSIWHSLFFSAFVFPIVALFHYQYEPKGDKSTFEAPLLKFIASSDAMLSLLLSSITWLVIGLAYFAVLPIFEMITYKHRSNTNDPHKQGGV